jgi:hypothetical protein
MVKRNNKTTVCNNRVSGGSRERGREGEGGLPMTWVLFLLQPQPPRPPFPAASVTNGEMYSRCVWSISRNHKNGGPISSLNREWWCDVCVRVVYGRGVVWEQFQPLNTTIGPSILKIQNEVWEETVGGSSSSGWSGDDR